MPKDILLHHLYSFLGLLLFLLELLIAFHLIQLVSDFTLLVDLKLLLKIIISIFQILKFLR